MDNERDRDPSTERIANPDSVPIENPAPYSLA